MFFALKETTQVGGFFTVKLNHTSWKEWYHGYYQTATMPPVPREFPNGNYPTYIISTHTYLHTYSLINECLWNRYDKIALIVAAVVSCNECLLIACHFRLLLLPYG